MNEFSIPLLHGKEFVNKAIEINKKVEKSKITNFYFGLPNNCTDYTGFEQIRYIYKGESSFRDFEPFIEYALEKEFDFIYLLNSPRPLALENPEFMKQIEKLGFLLENLKKLGVNKLRVTNPQLLTYLSIHYKDFTLYASTSLEYKTLKEFQNFIALHPTVKQIVPSHDVTKNFKLLKNLRKCLPNIDIELLTDEGCIGGCPHRTAHSSARNFLYNKDFSFSFKYFGSLCNLILNKSPILHICKSNNIYPWEIEEYNKIGINKFKLAGRDDKKYEKGYFQYLKGIDNIKNIENESINVFIYHVTTNNVLSKYKVKDIKPYLPDIKYFKKYGHLCASSCKVECTYCYKCAQNIIKKLSK